MRVLVGRSTALALAFIATGCFTSGHAADIPASLVTPDKASSRIGTLEFKDGVPSKETAGKLYDNLDFTYAYRVFMDNLRGVSIQGLRKGLDSVGVKDNEVLVFEQLMDACKVCSLGQISQALYQVGGQYRRNM